MALKIFVFISLVLAIIFYFLPIDKIKKDLKLENKPTTITIQNFTTESGAFYATINLSYHLFGPALHTAPIVLVNHALTGNSQCVPHILWSQLNFSRCPYPDHFVD